MCRVLRLGTRVRRSVVSGNSRGCPSRGSFLIKQLTFGAGGDLASFWVTFEQSCEGNAAELRGELRYNADIDMSVDAPVALRVEKGSPVAFDVRATSASGGAVSLAAAGQPPGAVFEDRGDGSGSLRWQTPFTEVGDFDMTFTASNGAGSQASTLTRISVTGITSLSLEGAIPWEGRIPNNLLLTPREGNFNASARDSAGFVEIGFRIVRLPAGQGSQVWDGRRLSSPTRPLHRYIARPAARSRDAQCGDGGRWVGQLRSTRGTVLR